MFDWFRIDSKSTKKENEHPNVAKIFQTPSIDLNVILFKWFYYMTQHDWKNVIKFCRNLTYKNIILNFFEGNSHNPGIATGADRVRFYSGTFNFICNMKNSTTLLPNSMGREIDEVRDIKSFNIVLQEKLS
ncbi:hypothetical protein NEF87_002768 [Candidatus Lokiarchaeum ossiferum]|uniref:Uncharacterized protein n=1 Tax=Candidatus Lokiarchaeum ossiferum TaxID=2951803 RepID=A0ABY6HSJ7_9ARCH|nr:hypothetical protein NEF87_002768 [Candidatus Lokiarchaeum sp. B-35]